MLINLSNHPSSKWSKEQKETANQQYGIIEDMEFPQINPHWSVDDVQMLAIQYADDIEKEKPVAVHLMGELTFCFELASLLKVKGILCIASTTERVAEDKGDQKISTFKFVQFRPYFMLQ